MVSFLLCFFSLILDFWIGAKDESSEGIFVWNSTGKNLSPGYQGWSPGYPISLCATNKYDCVVITTSYQFPAWIDTSCSSNFGGICELQPTDFSKF